MQDPNNPNLFDPSILLKLVSIKMPFGKFEGTILADLPIFYLEWFSRKGFPAGTLGKQLATVYEIKLNGLEEILDKIKALEVQRNSKLG